MQMPNFADEDKRLASSDTGAKLIDIENTFPFGVGMFRQTKRGKAQG